MEDDVLELPEPEIPEAHYQWINCGWELGEDGRLHYFEEKVG